ncbi:hypothetical protein SEUCBS140593_010302 [Sporothrix eucalyptigena]|uniref:AB hydrolase-1 domain-containing protein n=1 Tax=Sporothrix eucalyptigena TaxID=1812306 RepID=A0ABP0D0Y3_9PEZI
MNNFSKKTLTTKRSLTYTYYVSPTGEATAKHPALFFLHGFPDSAHLWQDVIAALGPVPNKIIVPDCLGYAGTDKPSDPAQYTYDRQVADLVEILVAEDVSAAAAYTVIIGHDWGSAIAQRVYLHHRQLFQGVVLVNTGYIVPSADTFDLASVNAFTEKLLGYPQFAYWEFATADDAAAVTDAHLEQMWLALHADSPQWMKTVFCAKDGMRNFLLKGDSTLPLKEYAKKGGFFYQHFMNQFRRENGGFAGAFQMYKSTANNMQGQAYAAVPHVELKIDVPVLYFICRDDAVCLPELMMEPAKAAGLVPKLREVTLDCGHWSPMEKPKEIAAELNSYLEKEL